MGCRDGKTNDREAIGNHGSWKQGSVLDWRKNPLESILVSDGQAIPPRCASHALLLTGRVNHQCARPPLPSASLAPKALESS